MPCQILPDLEPVLLSPISAHTCSCSLQNCKEALTDHSAWFCSSVANVSVVVLLWLSHLLNVCPPYKTIRPEWAKGCGQVGIQHLATCLAQSRHLVNICCINEQER